MNHARFAWISSPNTFTVVLANDSRGSFAINITDEQNRSLEIKEQRQIQNHLIIFSADLDFSKNYLLQINDINLYAHFSREILNEYFKSDDLLGPQYQDGVFNLKIWSPPAIKILAHLYDVNEQQTTHPMVRGDHGVWSLSVENLEPRYYQLEITAYGQTKIALDPYARSMQPLKEKIIPKAAIVEHTSTPNGFEEDAYINPPPIEMISYEMHIRDFTIAKESKAPQKLKGTYLGIIHQLKHLKDLGITHVQLMPVHACYTINECNKKFQDETIPTEQLNYNWGYDPLHYFIPNGWFASNPRDPNNRIYELKSLVQELHRAGIGVVLDVVFNHVYAPDFFENLAPGCYFRRNEQGEISGVTGAGPSLESRIKMVRRLIIDSILYYKDEFHIDGVRFDLMEFIDHQTMVEIRKKVGDSFLLYGEAWEFTDLPANETTVKYNLPPNLNLGCFNDTTRESYFSFAIGHFHEAPKVRTGIIGGIKQYLTDYDGDGHLDTFIDEYKYHCFADSPNNCVNYISIHDGHTLWDKLNLAISGDHVYKKRIIKLLYSMLLTSQGRVVLNGGDEIARSKPLAQNDPNKHRAHTSKNVEAENGKTYFHENSYRSPDYTNMFDWKRAKEFQDILDYIKGLISIRRNLPCLRYQKKSFINLGLRFVNENIPNSPNYVTRPNTRLENWQQLKHLTIEFINGPANTRLYIIGEIHGDMTHSKNPADNPYFVDFDIDGSGSITFTPEQVAKFDLSSWEDPDNLNIKLVTKPGEWDSPPELYSKFGCNTIKPSSIKKEKGIATIDLSIKNHIAGTQELRHNSYIAYFLDNTIVASVHPYKKLLIIHNADMHYLELKIDELASFKKLHILADGQRAGMNALPHSAIKILKNRIQVPGKCSAIIGCI